MSLSVTVCASQGVKTLRNTLSSYEKNKLLHLADERLIVVNNNSKLDLIAAEFGFRLVATEKNSGFACIKDAVAASNCKIFIFLEEDFELIEPPGLTKDRIQAGMDLISRNIAQVVRYRSRHNGGEPNWSHIFWKTHGQRQPTHLLDAVHWEEHPERIEGISKCGNVTDFFCASASHASFTLNPIMANVAWFKNVMMESLSNYQGVGQIEAVLNEDWIKSNATVAMGDGLFKHNRLDR